MVSIFFFIVLYGLNSDICYRSNLQGPNEAAARLVESILRRKSFYFQQRSGKLDMRAIGRVDVDNVIKEVDIETLQVRSPSLWVGRKTCKLNYSLAI